VIAARHCSKTSCGLPAAATLTYVYADSTVVVGALAQHAEPHSYDLCSRHAEAFSAPRGWDVVRIHQEFAEPTPSPDDLDALARAVRAAGAPPMEAMTRPPLAAGGAEAAEPRRGHLRVVPSEA
jgi:hypothetical protein